MKRNKGQGIVEYALILVLVVIIVVVCMALLTSAINKPPCDKSEPTAGQIIDCMATRTAEARHK